jgi:hypothetical protein
VGPSVLDPTAQREVAVYSALLRYEIEEPTPTGTATTPNPSGSTFFVQDQFFAFGPTATATDPNRFNALSPAGPVATDVQQGVINALAPTPVVFVPNLQAVIVPVPSAPGCTKVTGAGYVFKLGSVPLTGDQIQVYAGWDGAGSSPGDAGRDAMYGLTYAGDSWVVTGTVSGVQDTLGGCG